MNLIFILIVAVPIAEFALEQYLVHLNKTMWSDQLPRKLTGICPEEDYKKSQNYQKDSYNLSFWSSLFSTSLLLIMIIFGVFSIVNDWSAQIFIENPIWTAILFFAIIGAGSMIVALPFSYYETFVIEKKYGFNKMTIKTFFMDALKSGLISIVVGVPVLWLITWFYFKTGTNFWLYAWGLITAFSVFINFFYSELIVPLFNKQTPLGEGTLRTKIEEFSKKSGFAIKNIFVIDGSKRSTKSNAYFSGFGSKKRIVLYDTLLVDFTDDEIVAVLAHEIGHYKKKHIIYSMILSVFLNGLMLFLFSLVVDNPNFSKALGSEISSFQLGLVAFGILYSPLSTITELLSNYLSRKNEFEADKFSAEWSDPNQLANALKKLSIKNLSNMMPHPAYQFFYYSHPPLLRRLERLE
jgi:STE24 endopeptidase